MAKKIKNVFVQWSNVCVPGSMQLRKRDAAKMTYCITNERPDRAPHFLIVEPKDDDDSTILFL
jgi:hypothetical protein